MRKIVDEYGIIREIQGERRILARDDDIRRDEFHTLEECEGRFFLRADGNVSPYRLGSWYVEISPQEAIALQKAETEAFSRRAKFLCAED